MARVTASVGETAVDWENRMRRSSLIAAVVAALFSFCLIAAPAQASQTKEGNVGCSSSQRAEVTTYSYPGSASTTHKWTVGSSYVGGGSWSTAGKHSSNSGQASIAHYEVSSTYLIDVRATDCIPKPVL